MERQRRVRFKPYISSLALNSDSTFAMIADNDRNITSFHLPTGSTISSIRAPFSPQAIVFADGYFYCGGSDTHNSDQSPDGRCLRRCDVRCEDLDVVSSSSSSIYALAASPAGAIAAGGHSLQKTNDQELAERADVYLCPPIRSFSVFV